MLYNLVFVLKYRCQGKVKTVKTLLYTGENYSELIRIQDRNTVAGLHSVSASKDGNTLNVTITENNVD